MDPTNDEFFNRFLLDANFAIPYFALIGDLLSTHLTCSRLLSLLLVTFSIFQWSCNSFSRDHSLASGTIVSHCLESQVSGLQKYPAYGTLQKDIADSWSWWICALSFECIVLWISAGESICCVVHWWKTTALHGCDKNPELSAQEYAGVKAEQVLFTNGSDQGSRGSMWVLRKLGYSFGGLPPSLCYGSKELPSCPLQLGVALKRCNFTSIRPWTQVAKYSPHETHPQTSASADQTLVQGLTWWCAAAARRVPRRRVCRDEIAMFGCVGYESIRYRRIYKQIYIYIYVLYMYIYIYTHVYGKIRGPHCDLTGLMVSRRNYPKIALFFQVIELLLSLFIIYIYIRIHM